jgi:hypothetical protein
MATGDVRLSPAPARKQGRVLPTVMTGLAAPLGRPVPFFSAQGEGELWLAPSASGRLRALILEDDIMYVRQSRVMAFDGDLVWELGRLPGTELPLIQLRGQGRIVLAYGEERIQAFRLPPDGPVKVPVSRLLGWVGRVIAHPDDAFVEKNRPLTGDTSGSSRLGGHELTSLVACEGEGVLLLITDGELAEPTDNRPQSGDDGARPVYPSSPGSHRQF